jgi:hypothetical protein
VITEYKGIVLLCQVAKFRPFKIARQAKEHPSAAVLTGYDIMRKNRKTNHFPVNQFLPKRNFLNFYIPKERFSSFLIVYEDHIDISLMSVCERNPNSFQLSQ